MVINLKKHNLYKLYCFAFLILATTFRLAEAAGSPVEFGGWQNINGFIYSECPSGYSCQTDVKSDGVLQRTLTNASGDRYLQQVVNELDAARGDMSVESFVLMQNDQVDPEPQAGISARQLIEVGNDPSGFGIQYITMETILNLGWANGSGVEAIKMESDSYQIPTTIAPYSKGNSTFQLKLRENFKFAAHRNSEDQLTGSSVDISQTVDNHTAAGLSFHYQLNDVPGPGPVYIRQPGERGRGSPEPHRTVNENGTDLSKFVLRQRSGDYVVAAGEAILSKSGNNLITSPYRGPAFNRPVEVFIDWDAEDTVRAVWAGQICNGCDWAGWAGPYNDYFGYVQYDNFSDDYQGVSDFTEAANKINIGVEAWNELVFGSMPLIYPELGQQGPSPDPYVHVARPGPGNVPPVPRQSDPL